MHDVVVYLSSLPRIADRNRKVQVLESFAAGAQTQGAQVLLQTQNHIVPARLAVILGWVGETIRGPHIQLRQHVIDHQQQHAQAVMPIDGSCFKFVDQHSVWLRYSLDGVFYNTNRYANANSNADKWHQIQKQLGLELRPWRQHGHHVLVCLQRDGGWSMKGTNMAQWAHDTVRQLRLTTDRPILIRQHPSHVVDLHQLLQLPGVSLSTFNSSLAQNLSGAWAAVFYNSSACVAAVLAGIPVFVADSDCVAWAVANSNFDQIEMPVMPDRGQWLYDLSAAHWTDQHSRSGATYRHFLDLI